jgi:competence protein ComEC
MSAPSHPLAYAPLLPVAAAATAGLVADRYISLPIPLSLGATLLCLIAWALARGRKRENLALIYLGASFAGLAAAYHHAVRDLYPADDIGEIAIDEPTLAHVRGSIVEEPSVAHRRQENPLISQPRSESTSSVLEISEIERDKHWVRASGKLQLRVEGRLDGMHVGDEIDALGWLSRPQPPLNPGEWDYAARLRDQRIRATLQVKKNAEPEGAVVRIAQGWPGSFFGWLAVVRGWGQRTLQQALPASESGVAAALLLGENSAMAGEDWEKYVRTGVIHVLAISGQHLVVLGAFLWFVCRLIGVRRRRAAWFVAIFLLAYALLTGGRPSAMRAAVMVCAFCAGILLRRPALPANTFSLAWLVVLAINPTDLFTAGFQLSFLCVAVLIWGIPRWFPPREPTPLEQLIDDSRPASARFLRALGKVVLRWYLITLVLMLCTAPLVMYWQNVVSPAGVLMGPPAILLTSIALVAGFLLLPLSLVGGWAALPFAWITGASLALCEWVVRLADRMPGGCWYVPNMPVWWLIIFYGMLFLWMAGARLGVATANEPRRRFVPLVKPSSLAIAMGGWACVGLLAGAWKPASDEMRISFVAVGHGGCIVIETPDGRVLLYDAGANGGPDVTRRHIAPFLWSRGVRRIDEVFISHGDLDHFNGLLALADRFAIGQVTLTPSFERKPTAGVGLVAGELRRRGIAIRETWAGDRFTLGEVGITVLHPPQEGPEGPSENLRSMVLLVEHQGHRILLTGDLEGKGLDWLTDHDKMHIDVLMAPHHGSPSANHAKLAEWSTPKLAIACDGPRFNSSKAEAAYTQKRIPYWVTWPHGTVTLRSHRTGLIAETFRTGQRVVVVAGREN